MSAVDFQLTDNEKSSALWTRLKAHLQEKLNETRIKNDSALTENATATVRGEIKCLKILIALGDERPVVES